MTTPYTPDDEERRLLVALLHQFDTFSPPLLPEPHIDEEIPPTALFNFYDRHIAEHLRLKHISLQPSLHEDLARRVDSKFDELRDGWGISRTSTKAELEEWWPASCPYLPPGEICPRDLSERFRELIGLVSTPIASDWIISLHAPWRLLNAMTFKTHSPRDQLNWAKNYPWEGFALKFHQTEVLERTGRLQACVDNPTQEFLKVRAGEDMVVFLFLPYSPQSAGLLKDMDQLFTLQEFPSSCCATAGYSAGNTSNIGSIGVVDALKTPWLVPGPPDEANSHVSAPDVKSSKSNLDGVLLPDGGRPADFGKDGTVTAEGLLHHVWRTAVASNATFVVIHCGDFERIGVRHRGTQTLYLSKLLEVSTAHDPGYAKIHLGLQMAALEDAQDRYRQKQGGINDSNTDSTRTRKLNLRKRKREEVDIFPSRRCSHRNWLKAISKTLTEVMDNSQPEAKTFWRELQSRPLALVLIQDDDILNSPNPASCLRIGGSLWPDGPGRQSKKWKKSYKPIESLKITLNRPLYRGLGKIHPAIMEFNVANDQTLTQRVMAKVATTPEDQARLKHEYSIYKHLWERGVEGISCIFGLFEDIDNLATIMIMERGGVSLLARKPHDPLAGNAVELTVREKKASLSIITKVHQAGVLHGCIHPRHIVIGHDHKTTIIDFSRGKLNASEEELKMELDIMKDVVAGEPIEENPE
ncbi:hypothetical protein BDN72DRAFT_876814 [Pluteus cervinus]|uniref:Uncharacterized protein n=1 Tax=Pluteus cervinus TaxID=181527 RepID=A0ACD3B1W5_9AGAR|nr:hypothetical protein BDN72DRAFT_876814 [Pluteus cervinus]